MILTEELKLNLGARESKILGFKNMDIDPHPGVDIVGDVSDLSSIKDESVSEIYASNILEHFPHPKTVDVLKEWHRVLRKGGILYVSVPDFKRTVELYIKFDCLTNWTQNFLCGDQGYATAYHYAIFDAQKLKRQLLEAGFSEASQVEKFEISDPGDCSNIVSNLDYKYVCLNVVAVK